MIDGVRIRDGQPRYASDLAILADMATRRLTSFLWGGGEPNGIAPLGMCRQAILNDESHSLYYSNWRVADHDGQLLGGLNGYIIKAAGEKEPETQVEKVIHPLAELKAVVQGSWYSAAIAVFHESQGKAVGSALLADAEVRCSKIGCDQLTLMVGSFNEGAQRLYRRMGYIEAERRRFVEFPGSDPKGEWILMRKALS